MATSADAKLLKNTKFPPEFNRKVDRQKVYWPVMRKWIASKVSEILKFEDDVVTEMIYGLLGLSEGDEKTDNDPKYQSQLPPINIKKLQIDLAGFLEWEGAEEFCKAFWDLCLSAQTSPQHIPKELLEAKKQELMQEKMEADKVAEESRVRRENQERRDRELADVRDRERRDRGFRGGRGDNWRGGRRGGDRAFEDRGRGYGRGAGRGSSPPRRDSYQRNGDRYIPQGHRGGRQDHRRGRSVSRSASVDSRSSLSRSRSRSSFSGRSRRASLRSASPPRPRSSRYRSPPRHRAPNTRERVSGRGRDSRARASLRRNTSSPESFSESEDSRDASPPPRRRRYSGSSRSRSPTRRDRRRLSRSRSSSYSRSPSRGPPRQRPVRELISRSPSPGRRGRLRRSPTRSLSRSRSPESGKRSRGKGPSGGRDIRLGAQETRSSKKRRHSSDSPRPHDRPADVSEDEDRRKRPSKDAASAVEETKTPQQQANVIKEKLLREKIMKMRRTSSGDVANG